MKILNLFWVILFAISLGACPRGIDVVKDSTPQDAAYADQVQLDLGNTDLAHSDLAQVDHGMSDLDNRDQSPHLDSGSLQSDSAMADLRDVGIFDQATTDLAQQDRASPQSTDFCENLTPISDLSQVTIVDTSQVGDLQSIVNNATPGQVIALEDGRYDLNGAYLWISAAGVTIRSLSGNREAVILDGHYQSTEIITIAASDVTIADLTITRPYTHAVHVTSTAEDPAHRARLYNLHVIDPREQAIKINTGTEGGFPDDGELACSHLELSATGRPNVNPTATGCYTGGIDAHQARGWIIRDNLIEGFWCPGGLAEHAIHLWRGSRDTLVERNILRNNARGVGFGLSSSGDPRVYQDSPCAGLSSYLGHVGGRIRNNFIFANDSDLFASSSGFDCGICLASSCDTEIVHNTVLSTGPLFSSIEWRFAGSQGVKVSNNLCSHPLREREDASAVQLNNIDNVGLEAFVDGAAGDLHLQAGATMAVDQGAVLPAGSCEADIDGDLRDSSPDIGADELH